MEIAQLVLEEDYPDSAPLLELNLTKPSVPDFAPNFAAIFANTNIGFPSISPIGDIIDGVTVADLQMNGLVHISSSRIEVFDPTAVSRKGKFGVRGLYCAAGNYDGDTLDGLRADPNSHEHNLGMTGRFIIVKHGDGPSGYNQSFLKHLRTLRGLPQSSIVNKSIIGPYIDYLENAHVGGVPIDGIILMLKHSSAAEVVIARKSTPKIAIQSVVSNAAQRPSLGTTRNEVRYES